MICSCAIAQAHRCGPARRDARVPAGEGPHLRGRVGRRQDERARCISLSLPPSLPLAPPPPTPLLLLLLLSLHTDPAGGKSRCRGGRGHARLRCVPPAAPLPASPPLGRRLQRGATYPLRLPAARRAGRSCANDSDPGSAPDSSQAPPPVPLLLDPCRSHPSPPARLSLPAPPRPGARATADRAGPSYRPGPAGRTVCGPGRVRVRGRVARQQAPRPRHALPPSLFRPSARAPYRHGGHRCRAG